MSRAGSHRRPQGDDGSVLLLIIGFTGILLVLVGVVVDVSSAVLARRAVSSAADGAAVSAAQSADLDVVYDGELGAQLPLSLPQARTRVAAYEAAVRSQQPGLALSVQLEGRTAVVTATRTVRLPLRVPGGPSTVQIVVRAQAQAPTAP